MARRKESGFDVIAGMPWPAGAVLGILAFVAIRFALPAVLLSSGNAVLKGLSQQDAGLFRPFAWIALGLCWLAAAASFFKRKSRERLLDRQTGIESAAMDWRKFEMLVGEAFRRQGYSVEETGLGGADGGIDLILRKDGRTELVQCKQWRNRRITPAVVREMWGLVDHHQAVGVKIVCLGEFTRDAAAFAEGKSIELVSGEKLLAMIQVGQTASSRLEDDKTKAAALPPHCPTCGDVMVPRTNRRTNQEFWGCAAYPRCKGTRAA